MRVATAPDVRATIARLVLGPVEPARTLGEVRLHPHQVDAARRVRRLLSTHGGAVLADDVGLGKTFVALDVARDAARPIVIGPAAIRHAWADAGRRAGVPLPFVSVESLSRGLTRVPDPDLVVIDEAHHLRTRGTRRYAAASRLCAGARVLMLSATPVQNSLRDLRSLIALFVGTRTDGLTEDELAAFVIRRAAADVAVTQGALPALAAPEWLARVDDTDCLDRLLALPRAVPPRDGDDGGVLLVYTLVRLWASSRAALAGGLRRRLARARALEDGLAAGRMPTRAELATWTYADGAQQLAFPELAVTAAAPGGPELLEQVRTHSAALRALLGWLDTSGDPDAARVAALRALMRRHPGERVIAFTEYADTVAGLYRLLSTDARVAMLTHGGGRVAGGPIPRREVLARFAPGASRRVAASERIDLLLTTDVLSEGVNLQDASVVVHLDVAWNPARLQQRVGRVRRFGASRDTVSVYLLPPPAPAERMLQLERRLRLKVGVAERMLGVAGAILPGVAPESGPSAAPREERIAALLRGWHDGVAIPTGEAVAAAVRAPVRGTLACVHAGSETLLLGILDGRVTDARAAVEHLVASAGGPTVVAGAESLLEARHLVEQWLRRRFTAAVVSLPALHAARARRAVLRRVDTIARTSPRHAQPRLAPLMHAARAAATATLSSGAERVLDELARCAMNDEAWLQAVGEFATLHARGGPGDAPRIAALLLLLSEDGL